MREVAFIKQNKEKWLNFEQTFFEGGESDPEKLASLYIELTNDLAFAQTFYPNSKVLLYLNELATRAYLSVYKKKRLEQNRIIAFFKTEVPFIMYENRRFLYYAFLIFGVFTLVGMLSAATDENFVRLILGDEYVNMTKENIKKGDAVAVYKSGSNWGSFIAITVNNVMVSFKAFVLGISGGIGTAYILMSNAIMLGSFQYFFYQNGVLGESMKGIWIHGAMEIFSIVVCGASGFKLGAGLLFPETFSRFQSFKNAFKKGLKIVLSTVPFFIAAGFLEGYVTRFSNRMPTYIALGIIFITLFIIAYYYLLYPFVVAKKNNLLSHSNDRKHSINTSFSNYNI